MASSPCRILLRERSSQGKRVTKAHSSQMEDLSTVSRQKRRIHREKEDTGIVKPKGESHKRSFSFIREDGLILERLERLGVNGRRNCPTAAKNGRECAQMHERSQ